MSYSSLCDSAGRPPNASSTPLPLETPIFVCSCPFCACPVRGYQLLESRQTYERILAIEDEGAGLKAQVERFSRRVSPTAVVVGMINVMP